MNYDDFIEYVKENLVDSYRDIMLAEFSNSGDTKYDEYTWNNIEVSVQKVVKNNGIILDAVSMYEDGERISPNIYLKPFYDSYLMGKPLDFIMTEIIFRYRNEKVETDFGCIDLDDYETVRNKVVY